MQYEDALYNYFVEERMPAIIKRLVAQAKADLYFGPIDEEDYPGFVTATQRIRDYIEAEIPSHVIFDTDTGEILEGFDLDSEVRSQMEWMQDESPELDLDALHEIAHLRVWEFLVVIELPEIKRAIFGELADHV